MSKDIQTFIIWSNARQYEDKFIDAINSKFKILKQYEVKWTKSLFGINLSAFYGDNFQYNMFQRNVRGEGSFLFFIVEDEKPEYIIANTNRGQVSVNKKTFELKHECRKLLNSFAFHASNDIFEAKANIALILGKSLDDFLSLETLDGRRVELKQDIACVRGWKNLKEFFYILNEVCNYVVLRGFDFLPNQHTYEKHGDIDIMVDDMKRFLSLLNPRIPVHKNAFKYFNWEDMGENGVILIHPKFVGDNYYDKSMQKQILKTRVLNENNIYIPNDEMYFWSLLHHGVFHKENFVKYQEIFTELGLKLNIDFQNDKDYLCDLMTRYMKENNYRVALHLDSQAASLFKDNIKDVCIYKEWDVFYIYENEFSSVIFSEKAIFENPELVTKLITGYDLFIDLDRHILNKDDLRYQYFYNRYENHDEILWKLRNTFNDISVLSYVVTKRKERFFHRYFLSGRKKVIGNFITYVSEYRVREITNLISFDELLLELLIDKGRDIFMTELDKFISNTFYTFEHGYGYLSPIAWDLLPKNCLYDKSSHVYVYIDKEARYNKPVSKSLWLANMVLDFTELFGFSLEDKKLIYTFFVDKYKLDNTFDWSIEQRSREVSSIIYNFNHQKLTYSLLRSYRFNRFRYRLLSHLLSGSIRKKYRDKYLELKKLP